LRKSLTLLLALAAVFAAMTATAQAAKPGSNLIQFKNGGSSVSEGQTTIALLIERTATSPNPATVRYRTAGTGNTAIGAADCSDPATDYRAVDDPVTFGAGSKTAQVHIPICNNNLFENGENVIVELYNQSSPYNLGAKRTHTLTINDNDPTPVLAIDDAAAADEGTDLSFPVHRTGASLVPTSVTVMSASGLVAPIALLGDDFGAAGPGSFPLVLTWAAGDNADKVVTVPALDDNLDEATENMRVLLSSPVNGTFGDHTALGQINDTDTVGISAVNPAPGPEGGLYTFSVTLDKVPAAPVSVGYLNRNDLDGADAGAVCGGTVDYVSASGTLNWAAGDPVTKTFDVTTCPDTDDEPDEGIVIELGSPTGGTILDDSASGLITDDD